MGKRKYIIRLYKSHDGDLLTFVETHRFSIVKAVYCALNSFCNDEVFCIEIPPIKDNPRKFKKKIYATTLSLDEEKDRKLIELLSKIKDGKKNNFLKNLLRLYLCHPISPEFLSNPDDLAYFNNKFKVFREGRRIANAGDLVNASSRKKKQKNEKVANANDKKTAASLSNQDVKEKNSIINEETVIDNISDKVIEAAVKIDNKKEIAEDESGLLDLFMGL